MWLGDERFVSRDNALSNLRPVDTVLRAPEGVALPTENVHPVPVEGALGLGFRGAKAAAARYAEQVAAVVPGVNGFPEFDLVMVGVGPDGHVLSVFPHSEAFESKDAFLAIPLPAHIEPSVARISMNPGALDVARELLVIAYGAAKARVLADVLGPRRDERRWPAQRARRGGAIWLLDAAAASGLTAAVGLQPDSDEP